MALQLSQIDKTELWGELVPNLMLWHKKLRREGVGFALDVLDVINDIVVTVVMQDDVPEFMRNRPAITASGCIAGDEYDGVPANVGDTDTHKRVTNAAESRNDDAVVLNEPSHVGDRPYGDSPFRAYPSRGICSRSALDFKVDFWNVLVWYTDG